MDPVPPNKDSESYKKLRASLKRATEKHFEAPQPAPPSVKEAQAADPSLTQATPPPPIAEASSAPGAPPPAQPPARPRKQKRYWIKNRPVRVAISVVLLCITVYCLVYIIEFKFKGDSGQIWWPWEHQPPRAQLPRTTTSTSTVKPVDPAAQAAQAKAAEEEKRKQAELKRAQDEAAAKAATEQKRKQEEAAARAKLEGTEMQSLAALEASLKGYTERFQFEPAAQQMAQVGGTISTDKAQARWQQVWASYQPLIQFKQTLIANVSSMIYTGKPLTNQQGGSMPGSPAKADAEKIYFNSAYGPVGMAWENVPPAQIAGLAAFYLRERERQAPSKTYAQDYYNLMIYCLALKLNSQATQYGTEAITIDQSLRPKVKALLGNAIP